MTLREPQGAGEARPTTPIDAIAEEWVSTLVDLVPDVAIYIGVPGRTGEYGDLSPAGHDRLADATRDLVRRLEAAEPVDAVDEVTKADLLAESRLSLEAHDARLHLRDLNVIASPAQEIRESFDLMPTASAEDWATIAERLGISVRTVQTHLTRVYRKLRVSGRADLAGHADAWPELHDRV